MNVVMPIVAKHETLIVESLLYIVLACKPSISAVNFSNPVITDQARRQKILLGVLLREMWTLTIIN